MAGVLFGNERVVDAHATIAATIAPAIIVDPQHTLVVILNKGECCVYIIYSYGIVVCDNAW